MSDGEIKMKIANLNLLIGGGSEFDLKKNGVSGDHDDVPVVKNTKIVDFISYFQHIIKMDYKKIMIKMDIEG